MRLKFYQAKIDGVIRDGILRSGSWFTSFVFGCVKRCLQTMRTESGSLNTDWRCLHLLVSQDLKVYVTSFRTLLLSLRRWF